MNQKRPEMANRRGQHQVTHVFIVTCQKFRELDLEVLMHLPSSPNFAPIDYNFFLALQNFLYDKKLESTEYC